MKKYDTANATRGAREEYLQTGFTDYLTKPFKEEDLQAVLAKYLDQKLIQQTGEQKDETVEEKQNEESLDCMQKLATISGLDVSTGLQYCMDQDFYLEMLKEYRETDKTTQIQKFFDEKDWNNYRTLIHALKSTSMTIGAIELSEGAKALEMAARDGDESYILSHHREVMEKYVSLLGKLKKILK